MIAAVQLDAFTQAMTSARPPHAPYQPKSGTSEDAAAAIAPHTTKMQRTVLLAIQSRGTQGATRKEVEQITNLKTQTVCPRLKELQDAKVIRKLYKLVWKGGGNVSELVTREKCAVYVLVGSVCG